MDVIFYNNIWWKTSAVLVFFFCGVQQQLFVSSEVGVAKVALQHCELYGTDCAHCGLARDPYCSWDGQTCSRFFPSNKR